MLLDKFGFGDVVRECVQVARENAAFLLAVTLVVTTIYTLADMVSQSLSNIASFVVSVIVQYLFLEFALAVQGQPRRFGSFLGANLLAGIGIALGCLLFILPGIYLAARWVLAPAYVVANAERATDALSASWQATRDCWLPFAISFSVWGVLTLAPLGALVVMPTDTLGSLPIWQNGLLNLGVTVANVAGWVLAVAAYRLAGARADSFEAVFG